MAEGLGIWKVMTWDDYTLALKTGYIPDQPADVNSQFIYACSYHELHSIYHKYYHSRSAIAVRIDYKKAIARGFKMVYEKASNGTFYWHFYRSDKSGLLSLDPADEKIVL